VDNAAPVRTSGTGSPWVFAVLGAVILVGVSVVAPNTFVTVLATALEVAFLTYFLRHLSFAIAAIRSAPNDLAAPLVDSGYRPGVTVMVACKNEEAVVESLLDSLLRLDYPEYLLQFVLVDDGSADQTGGLLDARAATEPRIRVVRRGPDATGGKSGALNAGLEVAHGEIIIVFDADHQPHPDVVLRLVRHFEDPSVGAVQGRCVIRNAEDSLITKLVALDYLAGYLVNEYGRQCLYELPAYGGANCAVRAADLRDIGGWNASSVTEDTDLTLRLVLAGRRVRYDVTAVDEEEGVVTLRRFWRQRYRWARGHQQVWRDYRSAVWKSPRFSLAEKIETTLFMLSFHLPIASAIGLIILVLWGAGVVHPADPLNTFVLWTLLFLGPLLELGSGMLIAKVDRRNTTALVMFLPLFVVSTILCSKAWIDGMAGRRYTWVKTKRAAEAAKTAGAVQP